MHLALYEFLSQELGCSDKSYLAEFSEGIPVVGPVARSRRWRALPSGGVPTHSEDEINSQAWEQRRRVVTMIAQQADNDTAGEVWEKALDDRDVGYAVGPCYSDADVSRVLGHDG